MILVESSEIFQKLKLLINSFERKGKPSQLAGDSLGREMSGKGN